MATIQFKRGSTANLQNIIPAAGEPVWDKQLQKLKVGDGTSLYSELPYVGEDEFEIKVDGKSIILKDNDELSLFNFDLAEPGTVPFVNDLRLLNWKQVLTKEEVETIVATIDARIDDVVNTVNASIENLRVRDNEIDANVDAVERRVDALENQLAEFDPHRIEEALETVEQYEDRVDDLEADAGDHERRIQELERNKISPDDIFIIYGGSSSDVMVDAHQYEGGE